MYVKVTHLYITSVKLSNFQGNTLGRAVIRVHLTSAQGNFLHGLSHLTLQQGDDFRCVGQEGRHLAPNLSGTAALCCAGRHPRAGNRGRRGSPAWPRMQGSRVGICRPPSRPVGSSGGMGGSQGHAGLGQARLSVLTFKTC